MKQTVALLSLCTLLITGCASVQTATPSTDIFNGFTLLTAPRSEVEVGAQWIQGRGTTGKGLDPAQLKTVRSFSTLTSGSSFGANLTASLSDQLGLSSETRGASHMTLHDVEIVTINDLASANLRPGNDYIYEALKVGRIVIDGASSANSAVRAAAIREFGTARVEGGITGESKIEINASDLYFAYRVISIDAPAVKTKRIRVSGPEDYEIGEYEISVGVLEAAKCMCTNPDGTYRAILEPTVSDSYWRCHNNHPEQEIRVRNRHQAAVAHDAASYVTLPKGGIVFTQQASNSLRIDYMDFNLVISQKRLNQCFPGPWNWYDPNYSFVELRTMHYPIRSLKAPSAPGW